MNRPAQLIPLFSEISDPSRADPNRLGYVGRKPGGSSRDSDAWFTPPLYLDSVRRVLENITLDPFSSAAANKHVQAEHFFHLHHSAFDFSWKVAPITKVFMNPPYSSGLIHRAVGRFISEWKDNSFQEGIVLVNNATDTRWFKALAQEATSICFTDHRISFWNTDGKKSSGNTRGQAFLYFGKNTKRFREVFYQHGLILEPAL